MTILAPREKTTHIYALCDPDSGDVRYVGATVDPDRRLKVHSASFSNELLYRWIAQLRQNGKGPRLRILDSVPPGGDWSGLERAYVECFAGNGKLLNYQWHLGKAGAPNAGRKRKDMYLGIA